MSKLRFYNKISSLLPIIYYLSFRGFDKFNWLWDKFIPTITIFLPNFAFLVFFSSLADLWMLAGYHFLLINISLLESKTWLDKSSFKTFNHPAI